MKRVVFLILSFFVWYSVLAQVSFFGNEGELWNQDETAKVANEREQYKSKFTPLQTCSEYTLLLNFKDSDGLDVRVDLSRDSILVDSINLNYPVTLFAVNNQGNEMTVKGWKLWCMDSFGEAVTNEGNHMDTNLVEALSSKMIGRTWGLYVLVEDESNNECRITVRQNRAWNVVNRMKV